MTSPAQAGWKIDRAAAIAREVWHHPCVDSMRIEWGRVPAGMRNRQPVAWADSINCVITFDVTAPPTFWPEFCTRVLHEAGHLAQYRDAANRKDVFHSHRAASVMFGEDRNVYGYVSRRGRLVERGGDRRCRGRGRPFLRAHGYIGNNQLGL